MINKSNDCKKTENIMYSFYTQATQNVNDLKNVTKVIKAENGENGKSKDCFGKNAEHNIVEVPVGTIVRDLDGRILADLNEIGMMFIAARGGAGGHGNAFFKSDTQQTPQICEYGAEGEDLQYVLEVRSMAHIGLVSIIHSFYLSQLIVLIYLTCIKFTNT